MAMAVLVKRAVVGVRGVLMRRILVGVIAVVILIAAVAAVIWTRKRTATDADEVAPPVNAAKAIPAPSASPPDDGNWAMPGKDYAATRFSGLHQITPANIGALKVEFTVSTGTTEGFEAPPLVVDNTMYVVTPWPNNIFALDLTKPGAPAKWVYKPNPAAAAKGVACCGPVNRGASYWNGRLFLNLLDGNTVAVDAATGKEVWRTKLGDIQKGETITMAPLVAEGKVLVGNSGGEMGVRGWLAALDAGTGKLAWKAYSTGPDKDVLIGSGFRAPYAQDQGRDLGVKSWPPDYWKIGGGTVWGWLSYDPQLKTIYYGTSNPGPWNAEQRPGDNKWTAGVFARDIGTGQARWFYQSTPHDVYDHDDINEILLVDYPIGGGRRIPALIRPSRNGFFYVQDRRTGRVLSARPYSFLNVYKGVDLKTGRIIPTLGMEPAHGRAVRNICPAAPGAKDWNPSAFSPVTGLVYIPHLNLCMDMGVKNANYIAGTPFVGADVKMYAGPGGNRGVFTAWDPVAQRKVFEIKEDLPLWSPALATAGGLVFYGTMDGWFKAIDARTGKLLWQFKTGSGIIGQPISYRGPDGRQYIAVPSGVGGWAGAIVSAKLDARDPTGALGFNNAVKDLPKRVSAGGMVYVFALPK
ncbi:PQQ-dependent dehydrogenase, methanol/ethanol family [Sphingomonas sp. URHD0057]|uniref:PQQ-dependent dehydrogenase, methanol/ethanol family n=1 Tax=Sphingomonas sp. URHD0057 TaxID=1380389 RepID=UPI001E29DD81|nr:PQQ-dependent dehydrogenase, methanol/ethanol family [Sphingomonas sp. URHD0057]